MDDKEKLEELKKQLEEKKRAIPGHCSDTKYFMEHNSPVEMQLIEEIEELESEIKRLEEKLKNK